MTPSESMLAAARAIAASRWNGQVFDLRRSLAPFRKRNPGPRSQRLESWQSVYNFDPLCVAATELAMLSRSPSWPDQALHLLFWPWALSVLSQQGDLVCRKIDAAVHGLDLPLHADHVRGLALRRLGTSQPLSGDEIAVFLKLYDLAAGETRDQSRGSLAIPGDLHPLAIAAIRTWDTGEMVPALVLEWDRMLHDPAVDGPSAIDRLRLISRLVERSGADAARWKQLGKAAAAAMWERCRGEGSMDQGLRGPLRSNLRRIARLFHRGESLDQGDSASAICRWYEAAASCIASMIVQRPSARALPEAWAGDVLGWLGGNLAGERLVPSLVQAAFAGLEADPPIPMDPLAQLFAASRPPNFIDSSAHVEWALGELVKTDVIKAAGLCRWAPQLLGRELPPHLAAGILDRLPGAKSAPAGEWARLSRWSSCGDHCHRAVGHVAEAMAGSDERSVRLLLWEILLSPARRRPFLRAPVLRLWNRWSQSNPAHPAVAAMALLLQSM